MTATQRALCLIADCTIALALPGIAVALWRGGWWWLLPLWPLASAATLYAIARSLR